MIGMCASIIISQPFNLKPAKDSFRDSLKCILKRYNLLPQDADENAETTWERFGYMFSTISNLLPVINPN